MKESVNLDELMLQIHELDLQSFMTLGNYILAQDDVPIALKDLLDEEGFQRANLLAESGAHLLAATVAGACCKSNSLLYFVTLGLSAHKDQGDPVRAGILYLVGSQPTN